MAVNDNRKKIAEWDALKEKLNKAERKQDYEQTIALCHEVIKLDAGAKFLNIKTFLFYKDIGEAYFKLEEYKHSRANFVTAREGLLKYRATEKLKFPEDWLAELARIDKYIAKIDAIYFE